MQTRPSSTFRRQRYISPKPACPICQRKFPTYNDVYIHALETHKQEIDTTFTCGTCFQVCQNHKGLAVHRTHTHSERAWKLALKSGGAEDTLRKLRRLGSTEDNGSPAPIKLELPVACPASLVQPYTETCTVNCPVCVQTFSKAEMETHIGVHDAEIASAYRGLSDVAKLQMAELVLEMTNVKKTEA